MTKGETVYVTYCPQFPDPTVDEMTSVKTLPEDDYFWLWMDRLLKFREALEECNYADER